MNSVLDPDELLDRILSLLQDVLALDTCAVLLYDPEAQVLTVRAARGYRPDVVKNFKAAKGEGVTGHVLVTGEPIIVDDVAKWNGYVEGVEGARSEMAAPLRLDNQIIGVLDAESQKTGAFQESDLDFLRIFANQAATAIHNARLVSQLEQRSQQLEKTVNELALLNRLGRQMNANLSIDSLLDEVLHLAKKALQFDHCAILLKESDPDGGEDLLVCRAALGYREEVAEGLRLKPGEGVTGRVLKTGKPILVPDVMMDGGYIEGVSGGRCEMATPLVVRDEIIGVLDAESTQPDAFGEHDLRLFSTFAAWAAVALNNADVYARLERKTALLDRNVKEINKMNIELREYAAKIETSNRELERRLKELVTLQEASKTITSSLDLDDTLQTIVKMTGEIIHSSSCAIRLLDEESQEMRTLSTTPPDAAPPSAKPPSADRKPVSSLKSFLGVPLKIGNRVIGYFELGSLDEGAFSNDDRRVLQVLAGQAAIAIENARLFENTQQTYYETIRSLAQALEARDAYTKGHSERVTRYALATAKEMGISDHSIKVIRYAGLLHDIGKIGISDSILHKRLKLTDEDWEAIRSHPLFGDSILGPLKFLQEAQAIVLRHHERYDGSGYPGHLKAEEIPLEARIIAVADAYDAMTSDRPYRQAMDHQTAVGELDKAAGVQFDPVVVEAFLAVVDNVRVDLQPPGE
jgi:HD-GYP domain-containing protein (c-di-GMP phosphodiesterase class II)/putative methionine-R-sulfoxide reductase with GAF domain